MRKEITVCSDCGNPLIFTFAFAYEEWFCINCGSASEFLGAESTKATPELLAKQKVINDLWKAIYKSFLPRSDYGKRNCKKCTRHNHREHLSKQEILRDKVATKALKALKGKL